MVAPLLREEMDARGWSVDDLCRAFGTSAAFWRRLDALPPVR